MSELAEPAKYGFIDERHKEESYRWTWLIDGTLFTVNRHFLAVLHLEQRWLFSMCLQHHQPFCSML